MHVVIFTGGKYTPHKNIAQTIQSADLILAADGGANIAAKLGITPSIVIGDMDSITPKTRQLLYKKRVIFISHPQQKDETDTELALNYAAEHKASHITILGGIAGNRVDHILANILLSEKYKQKITFSSGKQHLWVLRGPATIQLHGEKDDILSLIPISNKVHTVTTNGLYYPLKGESLYSSSSRGVSNIFLGKKATVTFKKGTLCIIQTIHD